MADGRAALRGGGLAAAFHARYIIWDTAEAAASMFASAQLQRSRIAEGLGRKRDAVSYAMMFLNSFYLGPPSQKALIDEARGAGSHA